MSKCPDCIKDVTSFGETVLHLAVRYYKFDVLKSLLQWLEKHGIIDEVVNLKDREGNTILHYAVARKQLESVELLLDKSNTLDVNATNSNGLTPTDILNVSVESPTNILLKELIHRRLRPQHDHVAPLSDPAENIEPHIDELPKKLKELVAYFRFDSASEKRSGLLVVAVLFVTVAFQAGINLPSHIFPDDDDDRTGNHFSQAVFLACNTFILSASMGIIHFLTDSIPFKREVYTAAWFLMATYGCSIGTTRLPKYLLFPILGIPFVMLAFRWLPELMWHRSHGRDDTTDTAALELD